MLLVGSGSSAGRIQEESKLGVEWRDPKKGTSIKRLQIAPGEMRSGCRIWIRLSAGKGQAAESSGCCAKKQFKGGLQAAMYRLRSALLKPSAAPISLTRTPDGESLACNSMLEEFAPVRKPVLA